MLRDDPLAYFDFRDLPSTRRAAGALGRVDEGDAALLGSTEPVLLELPNHGALDAFAVNMMVRAEPSRHADAVEAPIRQDTWGELMRYEVDGRTLMTFGANAHGVRLELDGKAYVAEFELGEGRWNQIGAIVTHDRIELTHQGRRVRLFMRWNPSDLDEAGVWSMRCDGWSCDELAFYDLPVHHVAWWQAFSRIDASPSSRVDTALSIHHVVDHHGPVDEVEYSPDAATLTTASRDGVAKVWDARTGLLLHSLEGHTESVLAIEYGPDNATLATASQDGTARLWDPSTGRLLRALEGHTGAVEDVAYSPDGRRLATASSDGTAKIWDVDTGRLVHTLEGHTKRVYSVAYNPDGTTLATGSGDQTARIWSARTGEPLHILRGHTSTVNKVVYCPDATTLTTGSWDNTARVWDAQDGTLRNVLEGHQSSITDVLYSPALVAVLTASRDGTVKVWDVKTGTLLETLADHSRSVTAMAYRWDSNVLVTASHDGTALMHGHVYRTLGGHTGAVSDVAFSPDATTVATSSYDRTARIWDARSGRMLRSLGGHASPLRAVAYAFDGATIATASQDGTAKIWDARTGQPLHTLDSHSRWVHDVAYHPSSKRLATASGDHTVRIWDVETGESLRTLEGHVRPVLAVEFSPGGAIVSTASSDGVVRTWDVETGAVRHTLSGHHFPIDALSFSPDRRTLAAASRDGTATLWDVETGALVHTLRGHRGEITALEFGSNGATLATASWDGTARIWDARSGALNHILEGHSTSVYALTYAPDASRLVTGSGDGTAKVWDVETGALQRTLEGHSEAVSVVTYSPNASHVITASWDGTARIWGAETGEPVGVLSGGRRVLESLAVSPDGTRLITGSKSGIVELWDVPKGREEAALERPSLRLGLNHSTGVRFLPTGEFAGPEHLDLDALSGSQGTTSYSLSQIASRYNRPDIVLERMGYSNSEHLDALRAQWRRRLALAGLEEDQLTLGGVLEAPRVRLRVVSSKGGRARIEVRAADRVGLSSYQIRVNGVPVLPGGRRRIDGRRHHTEHTIELTDGANRIEVLAQSTRGVASSWSSVTVEHRDYTKPTLFFVGLGASEYDSPLIQDLQYAQKDVVDVAAALDAIHKRSGYDDFKALVPMNKYVTRGVLDQVRAFVGLAAPRDTVIVMVSGHGTYSHEAAPRYVFIMRDTDPDDLVKTGVALEELEEILASTPARKRTMWMDTCASGDLADATLRQLAGVGSGDAETTRQMKARSLTPIPMASAQAPGKASPKSRRAWVNDRGFIHRDLANRTGATILSSSRGFELSWESRAWENGAFTEALLDGLSGSADGDDPHDKVSLRELADHVASHTATLTRGKQHPVVDRDNPDLLLDFAPLRQRRVR